MADGGAEMWSRTAAFLDAWDLAVRRTARTSVGGMVERGGCWRCGHEEGGLLACNGGWGEKRRARRCERDGDGDGAEIER